MSQSAFIRRFPHRARRYLPGPRRLPGLETQLAIRPARFAVGLDEPVRWAEFKDSRGAPANPAFYLGRVDQVGSEDTVVATVWERPSGREATATLSVQKHFGGEPPQPGSMLRVWTWVELPGRGRIDPQFKVKVVPPELSEEERAELSELLAELEQDRAGELEEKVSPVGGRPERAEDEA